MIEKPIKCRSGCGKLLGKVTDNGILIIKSTRLKIEVQMNDGIVKCVNCGNKFHWSKSKFKLGVNNE